MNKAEKLVSIIIPTLNRQESLYRVLPSYLSQDCLGEVIVVDDGSRDDLHHFLMQRYLEYFESKRLVLLRHTQRRGAAAARNTGTRSARFKFVLFGEDDVHLEINYVKELLLKMNNNPRIGAVAGRLVHMNPNESIENAKLRFGMGFQKRKPFSLILFGMINGAEILQEDLVVPFAHALILTRKNHLIQTPFDESYSAGNGYREESVFQAGLCSLGYDIVITNTTRCYGISPIDVPSGGQRSGRLSRLYWNIRYTTRFFLKYYRVLQDKFKWKSNLWLVLFAFCIGQCYVIFFHKNKFITKIRRSFLLSQES